ncbi:MAG TPA: type II toxin-antitoxin system HicB family antitoxin [Longimicrobium sp.]|jgi:predicted HicB family RNase H-like nuclease
MKYKGYTARYEFDADDGVLHGEVEGIDDIITFVADNLHDLEREFRISVDDYLQWCAEDGVEPKKPREAQRRAS